MSQSHTTQYAAASALSDHIDTRTAATEVAHELHEAMGSRKGCIDLLLVFGSFHHRSALAAAGEILRGVLEPRALIATTAESVLADDREWEGRAGFCALAVCMPGVDLHTFELAPGATEYNLNKPEDLRRLIGYRENLRGVILLADPYTTPVAQILPRLSACSLHGEPISIAGALASGASQPGQNVLLRNSSAMNAGMVGVSISGDIELDFLVSQGSRPIGEPMVVTKADENILLELGGRPAMEMVQEIAEALPESQRQLLSKGLFVGVVIDEYKERFGRGDFLIRNVLGYDQKKQAMAVAERMRVGQTVQLHVRDAETATEDLQLLLDLQEVRGHPFAAAMFTCNGRGTRLFDHSHHDVAALRRRFGDSFAIAGMFAGGEIGPVGECSFVHGHTLSALLFREPGQG